MTTFADARILGLSPRLWSLIAAMALLRFALMFGTGPIHDEAYYWAWSQRLDFGYYDQPFLTGWFLAPFVAVLGDHAWVLRLVATLLTATTTVFLALSLRALSTPARRTVNEAGFSLIILCSPALWGLGLLYVHDTVMLAFLSLGLWFGLEALARAPGKASRLWWLAAGLALALAFSAKISAALWISCLGLSLLIHPQGRKHLRAWAPWAGAGFIVFAGLVFLTWNVLNQWVTFTHLGTEHLAPEASDLLQKLGHMGTVLAVTLLVGTLPAAFLAGRHIFSLRHTVLASAMGLFVLLPVLGFLGLAWTREIYLNWLMPSSLGLMVLGALFWPIATKRWQVWTLIPSALITLALILPLLMREPRFMLANFRDILGWEKSMQGLIEYRDAQFPGHSIVGNYYHLAAQTSFHQGAVTPSMGRSKRPHQFDLFEDKHDAKLAPMLVLAPSLDEGIQALGTDFCFVVPVTPWPVNHRAQRIDIPYLFEVRRPIELGDCESN